MERRRQIKDIQERIVRQRKSLFLARLALFYEVFRSLLAVALRICRQFSSTAFQPALLRRCKLLSICIDVFRYEHVMIIYQQMANICLSG
jgi:hypothetical protein